MYLTDRAVAAAVGLALFGSLSKELVLVDAGLDIPLDYAETVALMALRDGYLTKARLEGDQHDRYADALRQVQANTVELVRQRNDREGRPMPSQIARLAFDLSDPESLAPEPRPISHLSKDEAVVPLLSIAAANVIRPFEIAVPTETRRKAMEDLAAEMWLGGAIGADVLSPSTRHARHSPALAERTGSSGWLLGMVWQLVAATGGLALVAAPGVAGAAAITSALAAFGPGGMIGGLLTAGTLVTAGGGGIAFGLASWGLPQKR